MNRKCPTCSLTNPYFAGACVRCGFRFTKSQTITQSGGFLKCALLKRGLVCAAVCFAALAGFYASLIFSASPLSVEERTIVYSAIRELERKGFSDDVFYLRNLAVFRSNDNWLNASVPKENAYAATNFPFAIITLYPEFFTYPADDTERAAILLHEARHLRGEDEGEAYEFVWRNRMQLGWTKDRYFRSAIWQEVRKQTREFAAILFVCDFNDFGDCTDRF